MIAAVENYLIEINWINGQSLNRVKVNKKIESFIMVHLFEDENSENYDYYENLHLSLK